MLFLFFSYFLTIAIILSAQIKKPIKYKDFPKIHMSKFGLSFCSYEQHRIQIGEAKTMQVGDIVYIKNNKKMIVLKNVVNVQYVNGYLYFKGKGKVFVIFNCNKFYKYFCVEVNSTKLDISSKREEALTTLASNPLEVENNLELKEYVSFLKNTLNVNLDNNKIKIGKNKYKIPFSLTYKLNGRIKKINILETF